jgi:hypothetical protein
MYPAEGAPLDKPTDTSGVGVPAHARLHDLSGSVIFEESGIARTFVQVHFSHGVDSADVSNLLHFGRTESVI